MPLIYIIGDQTNIDNVFPTEYVLSNIIALVWLKSNSPSYY